MLLVPRQLARYGMTGNVPYYGGRLTPAQAYAAQRPVPVAPPDPKSSPRSTEERLAILNELLTDGTLTDLEYEALRARLEP